MTGIEKTTNEQLAAKLEQSEPLTAIEGKTAAGLVRIAAKLLNGGRPRKYATASDRQKAYRARKKKGAARD